MWQANDVLKSQYRLKQILGQNAGRQTWLALDLNCQPPEPVVVKLLLFNPQMHWDDFKLFEREGQVLAALDHPKIPKYRNYFSIDQQQSSGLTWFGLVQDYIPGMSLQQFLLSGRRLSETQVREAAIAVLHILIYLHELDPPRLHRDLKPSNLLLGKDKQIYLVDFGAAQDQATEGVTFTIVGTSGYAPPEQLWGRATPASDLYALGATLIHLITGIAPADLPQKDLRIQFSDRVSVQPDLICWLEKLTEPDLEQRFKTAKQALEALKTGEIRAAPAPLLPQPAKSRIRLQKSATRLSIQMPGLGIPLLLLMAFCLKLVLMVLLIAPVVGLAGLIAVNMFQVIDQGVVTLFLAVFSPFWIPWLISLQGMVKQLLASQQPTQLIFDRQQFILKWRLLGVEYRQQQGKTSAIRDVFESVQIPERAAFQLNRTREQAIVTMQSGETRYSFGAGLTEREQSWLIQEIRAWLK